jgi:hypothetical protein
MNIALEKWIELLALYGPMALFVFMVFVLLRRARATDDLDQDQKRIQTVAFSLVWLSIFVLAGMIVVAWWRVNFPAEFVVRGTIRDLQYPEVITTEEQIFLHKRTVAGLDFQYDWRFISATPFSGTIELLLQKKPSDSETWRYDLPIRSGFNRGAVEIKYNRQNSHMILSHGTEIEDISPRRESVPGESTAVSELRPPSFAPSVVYASPGQQKSSQPKAKPEDLVRALDVDDPLLRQHARRDLIDLGPDAIPLLERALTDSASSYRLRLGVLSTLRGMSAESKQLLHDPARCAISKAAKDADNALRTEAASLIASGITIPSACEGTQQQATVSCTTERLRNEEYQFMGGKRAIVIYLAAQSQGGPGLKDRADLFAFDASWLLVAARAGILHSDRKGGFSFDTNKVKKDRVLRALSELESKHLSYVQHETDDGGSFSAELNGLRYSIGVKTHPRQGFAEITVCPGS